MILLRSNTHIYPTCTVASVVYTYSILTIIYIPGFAFTTAVLFCVTASSRVFLQKNRRPVSGGRQVKEALFGRSARSGAARSPHCESVYRCKQTESAEFASTRILDWQKIFWCSDQARSHGERGTAEMDEDTRELGAE